MIAHKYSEHDVGSVIDNYYGLGDCSANVVVALTGTFLSAYYTDTVGIAAAAAMRFVMTQITAIITNAATAKLLASVGWRKLSIIYAVIAMILSALCFFGVSEHVGENEEGSLVIKKVPFKEAFPALVRNKYFYIQALLFMFVYIAYCCPLQTQYYYANIILNDVEAIAVMSLAYSLPTMLVNLIVPSMVRRWGKQKILILRACDWELDYSFWRL